MRFFADSADLSKIVELQQFNLVDGVTTNPSLILKSGRDFNSVARDICQTVRGPVSLEVSSVSLNEMRLEAEKLKKIAKNVVIKLPMTWEGLKVCKELATANVMVNMTLCFSLNQALLAARAGAKFVSPFVGRLDDINEDGVGLIQKIRKAFDNYGFETEVLAASIRSLEHVERCLLAGADAITAPPEILKMLIHHPLTDKGLNQFISDWAKSKQKI